MASRSMLLRLLALGCAVTLVTGAALAQGTQKKSPAKAKAPAAAPQAQQQTPPEPTNGNGQDEAIEEGSATAALLAYLWKGVGPTEFEIVTAEQQTSTMTGKDPVEQGSERHTFLTITPRPAEQKYHTWLEISYDRITMKAGTPQQSIEVDSAAAENPKAGPLAALPQAMAAIKGRTIRALMTPHGIIRQVEGLQDVLGAFKNAFPANPARDQIVALLFPTTNAAVAEQIWKAVGRLPGKAMEPGQQVPATIKVSAAEQLTGTTTFEAFEGEAPNRLIVLRQELSGSPGQPRNEGGMLVTRDQYQISTTARIHAEALAPVKIESTITEKYSARKPGGDPAATPDVLIQKVTRTSSSMLRTRPAGEAAAPADPAAPAPPAGTETAPPPPPPGAH